MKVCYLGESNLLNDLKLLIQEGVLCRNVWVVAKDSRTLQKVWNSVSQSKFRYVRLYESNFLSFLEGFKGQFDIIYFDPCTSLAEKDALRLIGCLLLQRKDFRITPSFIMHATVSYYLTQQVYKKRVLTCMHNECMGLYGNLTHDDIQETEGKKNNLKKESESSLELAYEDYSIGGLSGKEGERAKFLFDQYLRHRTSQFDANILVRKMMRKSMAIILRIK